MKTCVIKRHTNKTIQKQTLQSLELFATMWWMDIYECYNTQTSVITIGFHAPTNDCKDLPGNRKTIYGSNDERVLATR